MRKRRGIIITAIVLLMGIITATVQYSRVVTRTIYTESVSHLSEIFHQDNRTLRDLVETSWSNLHTWDKYLEDVGDEKEIQDFIASAREETGFTDFYFISLNGDYMTTNGEKGYLDLKNGLSDQISRGQDIVMCSVVPGKPQILVFAVPAAHGIYHGFAYDAIAVSYNNFDMVQIFEISAFDGKASGYVIHSDGRVIVDQAVNKQEDIYNFLAMLKKYVHRVGHVHLKDMRLRVVEEARKNQWSFLQSVRNGAFTVPGDGDVDFDPVFRLLDEANYQGWLLVEAEQDPAKADPLEYAIKARSFIRTHTGL